MKILTPLKRVLDYNISPRLSPDGRDIDLSGARMSINPFCEIALEEAVRLKESGIATEILAVSIGTNQDILRSALAMGADRALLIRHEGDAEPLAIAKVLAALVGIEQPELVLMGKQAIDDDCGQTGQMLASMLDWPQGCFVSDLSIDGNVARIVREIEGGTQSLNLHLPAVITVDLYLNEPRYISLPSIMRARQRSIESVSVEEYGIDMQPRLEIVGIDKPPERNGAEMLDDIDGLLERLQARGAL